MIKDGLNSTFQVFFVIYSSFHMWFILPHHVFQPAPLLGNLHHVQWVSSLFFFPKTICIENLKHSVIDET